MSKTEPEAYTKLKDDLVKDIIKKQELEKKLRELEDSIYDKETTYFNESMYGNIVKGFENFAKAGGSSNKKRLQYTDDDHIFSLSSTNYIQELMRQQGVATGTSDFDEYEDVTEAKTEGDEEAGTPSRKRKSRISDE